MNQIPNWFRWLIIVVATLIMCACRSPLQDPQLQSVMQKGVVQNGGIKMPTLSQSVSPLVPPINPGMEVVSHEPISDLKPTERRAAVVSRQDSQQRVLDLLQETSKPITSPLASSGFAPVVKQTAAGIRMQQVDSPLSRRVQAPVARTAAVARQSTASRVPSRSGTRNAVYLRVNDGTVATTGAQLDAEIGGVSGSPFMDDPIAPIPDAQPNAPAGPVLDSSLWQSQQQALEVIDQGPMFVDDAALPIQHQPIIHSPAPYEEYLPVEELPVETSPEYWAADPHSHIGGINVEEKELARRYPDEYICDGGDANGTVFVQKDWSLRNLDPEDTIGHYDTKDNQVVVEPSNKVCIYAPRFSVARQVTSAFQNESHLQVLLAESETRAVIDEVQQQTDQYSQTIAAKRQLLLQPASSLRVKQAGIVGIQRQAVNILAYDVSTHEDFRVMKLGIHKQAEKPRLAEFAAKAATWNHDMAVQILVDEVVVKTNVSRKGTETFFTIGDNGPAKLRVIKTASTSDALPGEEVEFTLRFDNIGYQPIGNVTIVDNLTTRLEFVDDSDLCSLDSEFIEDENAVESLTLRWEIKDPIEPGHGGLIRFRCVVR